MLSSYKKNNQIAWLMLCLSPDIQGNNHVTLALGLLEILEVCDKEIFFPNGTYCFLLIAIYVYVHF